jgi:hypothetical protein
VDKAVVLVRFTLDGIEAPTTLNIGGTGAKPMLDLYISSPTVSANTIIRNGKLAHCMYDAAIGAWIKIGADFASGETGLDNYVPPELCFQLAAEIGAHPWFNIPHYALSPMSDFTTQLAAYCAANQPSWMTPIFEPSNEVWNTFQGFYQTWYGGRGVAIARGWDTVFSQTGFDNWYGMVLSTMGQAVAAAYSVIKANVKSQTKYRVIGGVQTAGSGTAQAVRFNSPLYIAGSAQPGYALDPAKDWVTSVCIANYYTPPIYGQPEETTLAAAYAGVRATVSISGTTLTIQPGPSVPAIYGTMQANIFLQGIGIAGSLIQPGTKVVSGSGTTWTLNKNYTTPLNNIGVYGGLDMSIPDVYAEYSGAAGGFSVPSLVAIYASWKAFAQGLGIQRMSCYEGGYSPDLAGPPPADALRSASGASGKVARYNFQNHANFCALTDGTFTADFPSNYLLAGTIAPDPNGVIRNGSIWAVLYDIYQQPRPPQWVAMVLFNKGNATSLIVNN